MNVKYWKKNLAVMEDGTSVIKLFTHFIKVSEEDTANLLKMEFSRLSCRMFNNTIIITVYQYFINPYIPIHEIRMMAPSEYFKMES